MNQEILRNWMIWGFPILRNLYKKISIYQSNIMIYHDIMMIHPLIDPRRASSAQMLRSASRCGRHQGTIQSQ